MILVLALYAALAGAYLLVVPVAILTYLNLRWYTAGSIERVLMYFMVFLFFPGLLLLSPLLNFRPQKRQIHATN
ncbi:NAD(P)H-quinone oxidoreductase [Leptolyngbya sp. 'hensonii']|uniref:NAD(P)H-quinone oxidoreductase subunit L n=1 Tax=Leptolyngbya sp. 'hensonii' TaxID=1922337 RepID=UPI00094FFF9D|nr:NAD(P)H-quinone oxidoreductase subunit L [Leptolyngbya sp. 'hensonii']OLP20270.1 NAD(P)H-quinone oxidoreductase [Leptolyngbya sp. 'hensonii']